MKKFNNLLMKLSTVLAAVAFFASISSMTSTCYFTFNQPKMPEEMKKYRK